MWLITGLSGTAKDKYIRTLTEDPGNTVLVSLEAAAALIAEERRRDESDFVEGGVDIGRTARQYITEAAGGACSSIQKAAAKWGIESVLDRGLKYLSTGEIKRVLLCRAFITRKKLIVLSEPFAGLDAHSRMILSEFLCTISESSAESPAAPQLVLCMERYAEVPPSVTDVLEFSRDAISFSGRRADYEKLLKERFEKTRDAEAATLSAFKQKIGEVTRDTLARADAREEKAENATPLVEFKDVTVGWDNKRVLDHINWTLYKGEHWLIRGPNGAGKTTLLELITGDNMQVFSNEVYLFGKRRGTGETLWDLRKKLGIVSHRLHLEYRMVGGATLETVLISGFHDSIGLYEAVTDSERIAARKWLHLAGLEKRAGESFSSLSYGEQRASLILRAAVKCPPILILDEPCHALDEQSRRMILDLLETIAEQRTSTLLHVTHDPTEVLASVKHIFEFYPGQTPMYRIIEN